MLVIDYGIRTVADCLIDGIDAMARVILDPHYAATGSAVDWADSARDDIANALRHGDDALEHLSHVWDIGAEYLYDATGLHAVDDGYAGGLLFLTDDELASYYP